MSSAAEVVKRALSADREYHKSSPRIPRPTHLNTARKRIAHKRAAKAAEREPRAIHLFDLPNEIVDTIFSYIPQDLHISPRRTPSTLASSDDGINVDDGAYIFFSFTVGLRLQEWRSILRLARVSIDFNQVLARSIRLAARSHSIHLVMDVGETLRRSSSSGQQFILHEMDEEDASNVLPEGILSAFTSMKIRSPSVFHASQPGASVRASKILEVLIQRGGKQQHFHVNSTTWTESAHSRGASSMLQHHGWHIDLFFASGFDSIARHIRTQYHRHEHGVLEQEDDEDALMMQDPDGEFISVERSYLVDYFSSQLISNFHGMVTSVSGHGSQIGGPAYQLAVAKGLKADRKVRKSPRRRVVLAARMGWHGERIDASILEEMARNGGNGQSFLTRWRSVMAEMLGMDRWKDEADDAMDTT